MGGRASSLVFLVKGRKEGLAGMKVEFREVSLPSLFSFKVHPRMGKGRRKMAGKVYQVNRRDVHRFDLIGGEMRRLIDSNWREREREREDFALRPKAIEFKSSVSPPALELAREISFGEHF